MAEPEVGELQSEIRCLTNALKGTNWKYDVPDIQRDYVWGSGLAQDLWDHFVEEFESIEAKRGEDATYTDWYYLGALVVWKHENQNFIVDGQQRFTSLTILNCAMRDYFQWLVKERTILHDQYSLLDEFSNSLEISDETLTAVAATDSQLNEENEEIGGKIIDLSEVPSDNYDPIWSEDKLTDRFDKLVNVYEQKWISEDRINEETSPEDHVVQDDDISDFPSFCDAHDLGDFIHREVGQNNTLNAFINIILQGSISFYYDQRTHDLKPHLELKDRDGKRLKCIQNPITGVQLTGGRQRSGPPGKIRKYGLFRERRELDYGNSIYQNYDLFVDLVKEKAESFGQKYYRVYLDKITIGDDGPCYVSRVDSSRQIVHYSNDQLISAIRWFENFNLFLVENVQTTITTFSDIAKAYQAFVKINNQSQPLTLTDVIRALLLSKLHGHANYDDAKESLNHVSAKDSKIQDAYVRVFWISRNYVKRTETEIGLLLGKEINDMDEAKLLELSNDLGNNLENYMKYHSPILPEDEDEDEADGNPDRFLYNKHLLRACGPRQHLPILFSADLREGWGEEEIKQIHKIFESVYIFAILALGRSPSKAESAFAESCQFISEKNGDQYVYDFDTVKSKITEKFKQKLFSGVFKEDIIRDFSRMDLSVKQAAFILRNLEYYQQEQAVEDIRQHLNALGEIEYEITPKIGPPHKVHVEHILPQTITDVEYWTDRFDELSHKQNYQRIGNLTLLNSKLNSSIKNKSYPEKKYVYVPKTADSDDDEETQFSNVLITNQLAEYEDWNLDAIDNRSSELAILALSVWNSFEFSERPNNVPAQPEAESNEPELQDEEQPALQEVPAEGLDPHVQDQPALQEAPIVENEPPQAENLGGQLVDE